MFNFLGVKMVGQNGLWFLSIYWLILYFIYSSNYFNFSTHTHTHTHTVYTIYKIMNKPVSPFYTHTHTHNLYTIITNHMSRCSASVSWVWTELARPPPSAAWLVTCVHPGVKSWSMGCCWRKPLTCLHPCSATAPRPTPLTLTWPQRRSSLIWQEWEVLLGPGLKRWVCCVTCSVLPYFSSLIFPPLPVLPYLSSLTCPVPLARPIVVVL